MKTPALFSLARNEPPQKRAFTRLEFLAVLAGLVLLMTVALPLLAGLGPRSERIVCANNMRMISRAFSLWASTHDGVLPWQTYWPVGTQGHPLFNNSYYQYSMLSGLLESPRIFADPGDNRAGLKVARTWDNAPNGGLMASSYGNNSISYALGINASPLLPQSLILTDRNMRKFSTGGSPFLFVNIAYITSAVAGWTNEVHGLQGNLAFMDGRVEQADQAALRRAISWNTNWNNHFLFPY